MDTKSEYRKEQGDESNKKFGQWKIGYQIEGNMKEVNKSRYLGMNLSEKTRWTLQQMRDKRWVVPSGICGDRALFKESKAVMY